MRQALAIIAGVAMATAVAGLAPSLVAAHALDATFESRLPLVAYLAGAAGAVGLSFLFVLARSRQEPSLDVGTRPAERLTFTVPAPVRGGLRALGLLGWTWIVVQGFVGGSSDASVGPLFLWVYGWVGVALVSAFIGPVWHWLDPFTTLYDIGAWVMRRGATSMADDEEADPEPTVAPRLPYGRWPAVAGLAVFIWVELALSGGGSTLFVILVGYTLVTLAGMALYGRDAWRTDGETFSVWFGLLGRLAPLVLTPDGPNGRLRRRAFATGVLEPGWTVPDVVLVALGVGSILFDGLSQTQIFFDLFGAPSAVGMTPILGGFLALIVSMAAIAVWWVGLSAAGAGLLPIAVGYLAAHYLTYLLIDGQRILVAISDPLQQGWDVFGTAFFEPSGDWLPPGLVWTFQLLAVVGGHMIGAWAGHAAPVGSAHTGSPMAGAAHSFPGSAESVESPSSSRDRSSRLRQVPLALVMVVLTTMTLWSLGQAVVKPPPDTPTARSTPASAESPG